MRLLTRGMVTRNVALARRGVATRIFPVQINPHRSHSRSRPGWTQPTDSTQAGVLVMAPGSTGSPITECPDLATAAGRTTTAPRQSGVHSTATTGELNL